MNIYKKTVSTALSLCLAVTTTFAQVQERLLGGDISMYPVYRQNGTIYSDENGKSVELLPWLKSQGWNAIRVRLFVDPNNANEQHKGEGVCQDLAFVTEFARQIKAMDMQFMLDFHYSDTWADPGKQFIPKQWEGASDRILADSVYQHTRNALLTLISAGAEPDLIQVGNEITNGMLWPCGRVNPCSDNNWDVLTLMLKNGVRACREVCPKAKLIIHTEKAGDLNATLSYYNKLQKYGVDYDIIGLSYYPMWHKSIPNLGITLRTLEKEFTDKPVMIVETAAYYSHENDHWVKDPNQYGEFYPISKEGQLQFTLELVNELKRHKNVTGLFWWFPEENASASESTSGWLNRGLFDNHTGNALPALKAFNSYISE